MLRWSHRLPRCVPCGFVSGMRGIRVSAQARSGSSNPSSWRPPAERSLPGLEAEGGRHDNEYPFSVESSVLPSSRTKRKFTKRTRKVTVNGLPAEETVYSFPAPADIEPKPEYRGKHGTAVDLYHRMDKAVNTKDEDGNWPEGVDTPLAEAMEFLDGMLEYESDLDSRAEAYKLFMKVFLRHPRGPEAALALLRRQSAEGVPLTARGAIAAFKSVRGSSPILHELLPIMPKHMTPELITIFAQAMVMEQKMKPDDVRSMIGQSLAAVRREWTEPPAHIPAPCAFPMTPYTPKYLDSRRKAEEAKDEVPPHEWNIDNHFPMMLSYRLMSDFRGGLVNLNAFRSLVRMMREKAIADGREWPGDVTKHIVNVYTVTMSTWVHSMLYGKPGVTRVGRRWGSAVPTRLAVDLGNLLVPVAANPSKREHRAMVDKATNLPSGDQRSSETDRQPPPEPREAPDPITETIRAEPIESHRGGFTDPPPITPASMLELELDLSAQPMLSLMSGLFATKARLFNGDERYHFRNPFLATWMNAERIAGNMQVVAGIWCEMTGQRIEETLAGHAPPYRPTPEAMRTLIRVLRWRAPSSYRPLVGRILEGSVDMTPELLNTLMSAIALHQMRPAIDWSALDPPWKNVLKPASSSTTTSPASREGTGVRDNEDRTAVPIPPPAPKPDLMLLFILSEEYKDMISPVSLNDLARAIMRDRLGKHPDPTDPKRHHLHEEDWNWLNGILDRKQWAEARRTGRPYRQLPNFPLTEWDALTAENEESEARAEMERFLADLAGQRASAGARPPASEEAMSDEDASPAPADPDSQLATPTSAAQVADQRPALVKLVLPALHRLMYESILSSAGERGVVGTKREVFESELRLLKEDMAPLGSPVDPSLRPKLFRDVLKPTASANRLGGPGRLIVSPPQSFEKAKKAPKLRGRSDEPTKRTHGRKKSKTKRGVTMRDVFTDISLLARGVRDKGK